jgi:hypothetical protein
MASYKEKEKRRGEGHIEHKESLKYITQKRYFFLITWGVTIEFNNIMSIAKNATLTFIN